MPYNNIVARTDAGALIPEDVSSEIIQNAPDQSAAARQFRRATLSRAQQRMPVLSALPVAYFVNGDTGLKQTTQQAWANKFINVEEIAAIVPIPENVVDDVDFDVWGEIRPRLEEAVYRTLDAAIFFGTGAPGTWPTAVQAAAVAAANTVNLGTNIATAGGIFGDLDDMLGLVEDDGFDTTGWVADRKLRTSLRKARNSQGDRVDRDRVSADLSTLDGDEITYAMRGLWGTGSGSAVAFTGDWTQFVLGVRKDISWKVLTEAVITDNTGAIIYNLPQQDMVALRITFRAGWQVANPLTREQPTEASRYPAAVLRRP
jgi:HK97 family phage major capsid protein